MLEDPDEGVRGRTVEELGKDVTTYAERRASVEEMINDPDPWVRYVAESKRQAAEAATAERGRHQLLAGAELALGSRLRSAHGSC